LRQCADETDNQEATVTSSINETATEAAASEEFTISQDTPETIEIPFNLDSPSEIDLDYNNYEIISPEDAEIEFNDGVYIKYQLG
jgi:hypothetical protein